MTVTETGMEMVRVNGPFGALSRNDNKVWFVFKYYNSAGKFIQEDAIAGVVSVAV